MQTSVVYSDSSFENLFKFRSSVRFRSRIRFYAFKILPLFFFIALPYAFVWKIILGGLWWLVFTVFFDHRVITDFNPTINVWFGIPGSGKTSMAAYLTRNSLRSGYTVLSNVHISGALKLDPDDLGRYDMSFGGAGAHVIYDEGSIDFDNRNFKSFAASDKPSYFALHRHMMNRVDVFSQAYDIDKRIRDRAGAAGLFQLRRLPFRGFIMYRRIKKVLFIKKDDKQMIDGFAYTGLPRVVYVRSVWSSFDTLDLSLCPKLQKKWQPWDPESDLSDCEAEKSDH